MLSIEEAKRQLLDLKDFDKSERLIQTAAILTKVLLQLDIKPIVVGGLSVEIYTRNGYTTQDIDFVLSGRDTTNHVLVQLGFEVFGKNWVHPVVGVSVEIPDNHLVGDYEKVTELQIGDKVVYLIGIEDIILDRLRAAVHWKDGESREWGYRLLFMYFEDVDVSYIRGQFENEKEKLEFEQWYQDAIGEINQMG